MKKIIAIILALLIVLCLSACGTDVQNNSVNNANVADPVDNVKSKEIAYEIVTHSDYNKLATDFDGLVKDSDLILKISVENVIGFVDDNAMIQTEITPKVQKVYKGSYDGQKLYVNGGEMLYEEFYKNENIKKALSGHENPDGNNDYRGKYIRQSVDGQYIFNIGEEYIFFAKKREDSGKYYSLYAYQGTYKIVDGLVENVALDVDEPLKNSLNQVFDNVSSLPNETKTYSVEENFNSKNIATEEKFVNELNDLIN